MHDIVLLATNFSELTYSLWLTFVAVEILFHPAFGSHLGVVPTAVEDNKLMFRDYGPLSCDMYVD
jgi:hypothetical protein